MEKITLSEIESILDMEIVGGKYYFSNGIDVQQIEEKLSHVTHHRIIGQSNQIYIKMMIKYRHLPTHIELASRATFPIKSKNAVYENFDNKYNYLVNCKLRNSVQVYDFMPHLQEAVYDAWVGFLRANQLDSYIKCETEMEQIPPNDNYMRFAVIVDHTDDNRIVGACGMKITNTPCIATLYGLFVTDEKYVEKGVEMVKKLAAGTKKRVEIDPYDAPFVQRVVSKVGFKHSHFRPYGGAVYAIGER